MKKTKKLLSIILSITMLLSTLTGLSFTALADYFPSSGSCGQNATYTFDEATGLLTISGTGTIYSYDFEDNTLIKSVVIENGITGIGSDTFEGCSELTSVEIPDSVTTIGSDAFFHCSGLTSIFIPKNVTTIGEYAFRGCSGLNSITVENGNPNYDSRNNCNAIIDSSTNELMRGCMNTVIPDSVTTIGDEAFSGCSGLTSIFIPKSVTEIYFNSFEYCSGLSTITVDDENPVYDSRNNCNAIIESSTNTLKVGCKNTVIPNTVKSIGFNAFSGCTGLTTIEIPDSVESIGYSAFSGCTGLTTIEIPDSVEEIKDQAFWGCSGLISIIVDSENPVYDSRNNCNAIIESSTNELIQGCMNTVIPNTVKSIGEFAFYGCTGLTSIVIPNGVTSIGFRAFAECLSLTSVTLPKSITSIGSCVFDFCEKLSDIYYDGTVENWMSIEISKDSETAGQYPPITIHCTDGIIIDGVGYSSDMSTIVKYDITNAESEFTVPDSVTTIADNAFEGSQVEEVYLSENTKRIGAGAFKNCKDLVTLGIPCTTENIADSALDGCDNEDLVIIGPAPTTEENAEIDTNLLSVSNRLLRYAQGTTAGQVFAQKNNIPYGYPTFVPNNIPDQTYTGKEIRPQFTVKINALRNDGSVAKTITLDDEYYKTSYINNINVGTATIAIVTNNKFRVCNNEKGYAKTTTFKIVSASSPAATQPAATPALKKVKAGKKCFTASWAKVSGATAYEVQYATNKKFRKAKTKKVKPAKSSVKIKKLKSGKTYFVRVRTVSKTGKSAWSKVKKVKVK